MSREIHSKLWPKSNMTMLLNFVPGRMVFYSHKTIIKFNEKFLWYTKTNQPIVFLTNDEHVYVNCNKIFHANFQMHVVNFTDE